MISIANTSDNLQVIPSKGGSKDLPAGTTDTFEVSADNPHVQAKVQAGLIRIVEPEPETVAAPEPEAAKPAPVSDASLRSRTPAKPSSDDQPGGSTSTL